MIQTWLHKLHIGNKDKDVEKKDAKGKKKLRIPKQNGENNEDIQLVSDSQNKAAVCAILSPFCFVPFLAL